MGENLAHHCKFSQLELIYEFCVIKGTTWCKTVQITRVWHH